MHEIIAQVREKQAQARLSRNKGDALRKANREHDARIAYEAGVLQLSESAELLSDYRSQLKTLTAPLSSDLTEAVSELAEICGALGGLYQRLGLLDKALASYTEGAGLEEHFELRGGSTNERVTSCEDTSAEACEHFAGASKPRVRQTIQPTPRTTGTGGIDGFPLTGKPTCCFQAEQNRIQGARGQAAARMHVRTGQLRQGILEEYLEHPKRLQGHARIAILFSHSSKST